MTETDYRKLVERFQRIAKQHPAQYRRSVAMFMWIGRLFPLVVVVSLVVLVAGFIAAVTQVPALVWTVKAVLVLLVPAAIIVKSMLVSVPPPQGVRASRDAYPQLWQIVDEVAASLNARTPHHIVFDNRFNASLASQPRLLGAVTRHHLILGLPLLHALDEAHARTVVAHELAHLVRGHGRIGARAYRTERALHDMVGALHRRSDRRGAKTLLRFYDWYMPRFAARMYALRFQHEIDADRLAAEATSAELHAEALTAIHLRSLRHEYGAQRTRLQRATDPESMRGELAEVCAYIAEELHARRTRLSLAQELLLPQDPDDEHPALAARMRLVGYEPPVNAEQGIADHAAFERLATRMQAAPSPAAARPWLGSQYDHAMARVEGRARSFDPDWFEHATEWRTRTLELLASLDERLEAGTLDGAGYPRWARLAFVAGRETERIQAQLQDRVAAAPEDTYALLGLSQHLMTSTDPADHEAGRTYSVEVAEREPVLEAMIRAMLHHAAATVNDREAYAVERALFVEAEQRYRDAAMQRREQFQATDTFVEVQLPAGRAERLREGLMAVPSLGDVFIARRTHEIYPDAGHDYVLLLTLGGVNAGRRGGSSIDDAVGELYDQMMLDAEPLEDWSVYLGRVSDDAALQEVLKSPEFRLPLGRTDAPAVRSYAELNARLGQ